MTTRLLHGDCRDILPTLAGMATERVVDDAPLLAWLAEAAE